MKSEIVEELEHLKEWANNEIKEIGENAPDTSYRAGVLATFQYVLRYANERIESIKLTQ